MPNTAEDTGKEKFVPTFKPTTVVRNDVELTFQPAQVKKGDDKGTEYLAPPEIKAEDVGSLIAWIDPSNVVKKLTSMLRTLAQAWWFEAVEQATDKDNGQLDVEKAYEVFKQLASEFSARGESIPDLKNQIQELIDSISECDPSQDDYATQVKGFADQIKSLNIAIASKKRKTKEEKAAEAAEAKA